MSSTSKFKKSVLSLAVLFLSAPLMATPLEFSGQFNAYGINNFNYQTTDIEGIIGSGGDVIYIGGDVGRYNAEASTHGLNNNSQYLYRPYSIYAGGDVVLQNHAVRNGGIQANGRVTTTDVSIGGNVNVGGDVFMTRGSMVNGATIDSGGSLTVTDFGVRGLVTSQGNVTITRGGSAVGADINATGNVLFEDAGVGGNINSNGSIEIKSGSSTAGTAFRADGDLRTNNHGVLADVHVGGTFTGVSGSVVGVVEAYGGVGIGNDFWLDPSKHLLGSGEAIQPNVTIAPHQSAAIDHAAIAAEIVAVSQGYAALDATAAVEDNDGNNSVANYIFNGISGLNIFDLDASMISSFASMTFNGEADSTFVLNISGTDVDFLSPGGMYFNGVTSNMLLFNLFEAEAADISGSIFGTILAPDALLHTNGNGTIFGSVYAFEVSGSSQINSIYFEGEGPNSGSSVSLPGTLPLLGLGLLGLLWGKRKAA